MIVFTKAKWTRITSIIFFSGPMMTTYKCLTNNMLFPKTPSKISERKIVPAMRSLQIIFMLRTRKTFSETQGSKHDIIHACGFSVSFSEMNCVLCKCRVICLKFPGFVLGPSLLASIDTEMMMLTIAHEHHIAVSTEVLYILHL